MPVLLALIPLIQALLGAAGGASVMGIFTALSLGQWLTLAGALADAGPEVVLAVRALHPLLDLLAQDVERRGPQAAGTLAWRRRQPPKIPGYLVRWLASAEIS